MITAKFVWKADRFQEFSTAVRTKFIRIALNAGAAVIKEAVIGTAPVDQGNLQKSIGIKVVKYKGGNMFRAIIGAKRSFKRVKKVKDKKTGKAKIKKYIHKKTGELTTSYIRPGSYIKKVEERRRFLAAAYTRTKDASVKKTESKLAQQISEFQSK